MADQLLIPSRRGFLAGLGAFAFAAPAIVRASSLMPVKALSTVQEEPVFMYPLLGAEAEWFEEAATYQITGSLLSVNEITREAVKLFVNSHKFISQYDDEFNKAGVKIGSTIRIRLPGDFTIRQTASFA
jgi:hypothetical protein